MKEIVGKAEVFVKKQVETHVFEGEEMDGRRRGRKDGGRTEGGRSQTIIHTRSGGAGIVT